MKSNSELLGLQRTKGISSFVQNIIGNVVYQTLEKYPNNKGEKLAALFDLFVSCEYYGTLANKGWTYCPHSPNMLLYTYTNACPRCLSKGEFVFTKANKPGSGQIGMITTEILCEMLIASFKQNGRNVEIYKASEPVDVIIYEPSKKLMIVAEVKAAPLLTIPVGCECEPITEEVDGILINSDHCLSDNPFVHNTNLFLFFPKTTLYSEKKYNLNLDWQCEAPFFKAIADLIDTNSNFLNHYFSFWNEAFNAYSLKERTNPVFWLTNACGLPTPRPNTWPKRKSGGYETISDAKTSVGMDRTDDIKKGIYQLLKLGAEFKPKYSNLKTALISNIHAVRHNDEYLQCIKDIIWTIDETRKIKSWSEIPHNTPLYNLFDGIVAFTKSDIRDNQLSSLFKF